MSKTWVSPMSRKDIRNYANKIRNLLCYRIDEFIHAPKLFDALSTILSKAGLDFDYRVLPDGDKAFIDKEEAFTDMSTGIIYIKEIYIISFIFMLVKFPNEFAFKDCNIFWNRRIIFKWGSRGKTNQS